MNNTTNRLRLHISFLGNRLRYDHDRSAESMFRTQRPEIRLLFRAFLYDAHVRGHAIAICRPPGFSVDGIRLGNIR